MFCFYQGIFNNDNFKTDSIVAVVVYIGAEKILSFH